MATRWIIDSTPTQHGNEKSDWIGWLKRGDVHVLVQMGHQITKDGADRAFNEFIMAPHIPEMIAALEAAKMRLAEGFNDNRSNAYEKISTVLEKVKQ